MTTTKFNDLLKMPGMTVTKLNDLLALPGMTVTKLDNLLKWPGMSVTKLDDLLRVVDDDVIKLEKLLLDMPLSEIDDFLLMVGSTKLKELLNKFNPDVLTYYGALFF